MSGIEIIDSRYDLIFSMNEDDQVLLKIPPKLFIIFFLQFSPPNQNNLVVTDLDQKYFLWLIKEHHLRSSTTCFLRCCEY